MPLTFNPKRKSFYLMAETLEGTLVTSTTLFVIGNATLPVESLKFTPDVAFEERNPLSPTGQPLVSIANRAAGEFSFNTPFVSAATAGVAGPLSPLLRTFMAEVLVADTSSSYHFTPFSTIRLSAGYGTIREDGTVEVQVALSGCGVSKASLKADGPGKRLMVDWTIKGKQAYATAAPVVIDDSSPQTAIVYVDDLTDGFTFRNATVRSGMFSRNISKFELDFGLTGDLGVDIGDGSTYDWFKYGDCKPIIKLDPAMDTVANAPDLATLISGGHASAGFTVTNSAGRTLTVSIPNLQPTKLSEGSRDQSVTWEVEALCARSSNGVAAATPDAYSLVIA